LPSRRTVAWLLRKEWRALMASNAWWLMLILIGPLAGVSFISATRTYAELSAYSGGVGETFSPLLGVWAPTFSACELAAAFLLPFVVIRLVGGDRQTGALKIELQRPMPAFVRIAIKAVVLLAGWGIATLAPVAGIVLWSIAGGHLHIPELFTLMAGHVLNAALTIALASAAAIIADHPATAAIATLAVTVGTWILNFIAAVHGGVWARAAEYTPTAMVAEFQHGLVRVSVVLVALGLIGGGLGLASIWIRLGSSVRQRLARSAALLVLVSGIVAAGSVAAGSWDLSENRMNSFSRADEKVLGRISGSLQITAYLAPEDPRRTDLEQHSIAKLRRVVPDLDVRYVADTSTGLFEQTAERYGEIHYRLADRERVSRATTAEGVLEAIYEVIGEEPAGTAGASLEDDEDERESVFRGYPLAEPPAGAAAVFYGAWPAVALLAALRSRRRGS
jgi:ABC-2 type transport system permease protein